MGQKLPVSVDAMGGDLGPSVVVAGAIAAAREFGIHSALVGEEKELRRLLAELGAATDGRLSVVHAPDIVTMEESPSTAIRRKPKSSIRIAYDLVKRGEASSLVSPGNTGAVMAAGIFVCGALPGIVRPAIASLIPKIDVGKPPTVLLDSGANIECTEHQLVQFALMGAHYAKSALGIAAPRVALLSNGSESSKGTDVVRGAAETLSKIPALRYVGYVEGRDLARDLADVVACDGFVGNVVLKAMEGAVELVMESMKQAVEKSLKAKLGMWLARPTLKSMVREKLDPSAYGGAPLLGLRQISVICHGSSNERAMMNGIRVAHQFAESGLVRDLEGALASAEAEAAKASRE